MLLRIRIYGHIIYHIAGKFDMEFNLAIWRIDGCIAKFNSTNFMSLNINLHNPFLNIKHQAKFSVHAA